MEFPTIINWMYLLRVLGLLGNKFQFHLIFKSTFSTKQTLLNLIRRRVLRRLIWFCTVCRYPINRTLGLNGLKADSERSKMTVYSDLG